MLLAIFKMEENNVATQKRRLGEILVTSGEITQSQLDQALAEQKTNGKRLGETLISLNFLTERKMLKTLEKQLSIPYMFLSDIEIIRPPVQKKHLLRSIWHFVC